MARLGQLSNDELAGEEEAVMTVMSLLGELMSVVDVNFNVSRAIGRASATAFLQTVTSAGWCSSTPI